MPRKLSHYPGFKFGRFEVISYKGNLKWEVKCTCGTYEEKSSKQIGDMASQRKKLHAMCDLCKLDNLIYPARSKKGNSLRGIIHKKTTFRKVLKGTYQLCDLDKKVSEIRTEEGILNSYSAKWGYVTCLECLKIRDAK